MEKKSLVDYVKIYCNIKLASPFTLSSKSLDNIYLSLASITTIALVTFIGLKELKTYSHIKYLCNKYGFQNFMFEKKGLKRITNLYAKLNKKISEFNKAKETYMHHKEVNSPNAANSN